MTTIAEIARAADVSVESVLRVINRDEVSSDVAARVLSAMEACGYDRLPHSVQTRRSQGVVVGEVVADGPGRDAHADDAVRRAREQLLQAVGDVVNELENPEILSRASDPLGIRALADRIRAIDARFERVARDVEGMKRELVRARHERLEDLTLLVDLITTSWRAVDRRLGRIDRKLERLEGLPEPSGGGRLTIGEAPRNPQR